MKYEYVVLFSDVMSYDSADRESGVCYADNAEEAVKWAIIHHSDIMDEQAAADYGQEMAIESITKFDHCAFGVYTIEGDVVAMVSALQLGPR